MWMCRVAQSTLKFKTYHFIYYFAFLSTLVLALWCPFFFLVYIMLCSCLFAWSNIQYEEHFGVIYSQSGELHCAIFIMLLHVMLLQRQNKQKWCKLWCVKVLDRYIVCMPSVLFYIIFIFFTDKKHLGNNLKNDSVAKTWKYHFEIISVDETQHGHAVHYFPSQAYMSSFSLRDSWTHCPQTCMLTNSSQTSQMQHDRHSMATVVLR